MYITREALCQWCGFNKDTLADTNGNWIPIMLWLQSGLHKTHTHTDVAMKGGAGHQSVEKIVIQRESTQF